MKQNRILVVDDEKVIRELFLRLFSAKYEMDTARDGKEALEKLAARRPGLVFLDMMMPGISGMDLLKEVFKSCPGINVLVMTGVAFEDMKNAVLETGARGFIRKPFTIDELEKYVEQIFYE